MNIFHICLFIGIIFFIPTWALNLQENPAKNFRGGWMELFASVKSTAVYQTLTHISGAIANNAGTVSFTQGDISYYIILYHSKS